MKEPLNLTHCQRSLGKSSPSRQRLTKNEQMDVVHAFIGEDRLQVVHVSADGVVQRDAIGPKKSAGLACCLQRFAHIITLGQGNLNRVSEPFLL